jgi:pheromone a factor receptor
MLLAFVDMMFTIPFAIYSTYIANKGVGMAPWISWQDTHFDFGRIGFLPTIIWRSDRSFEISVELTRWLPVFCAFLFFALFGFAAEAKKHYSLIFRWVTTRLGIDTGKGINISVPLPGYVVVAASIAQETYD